MRDVQRRPVDWNRFRYSVWAPGYDRMVAAFPSFDAARRQSIARLDLQPGQRVLLVGPARASTFTICRRRCP
jgi:hypothetical protein